VAGARGASGSKRTRRAAVTRARGATASTSLGRSVDLRDACLAAITARRGKTRARGPVLGPGQLAAPITLAPDVASGLFAVAFRAAAGAAGEPPAGDAGADVVWTEADAELLVHAGRARLVLLDGQALAGLPVFTEQTGEVEVAVPFATGTPRAALGLVIATEPVPRGPAALVARFGDALVAAAWDALLAVMRELAAASGVDARQEPLQPASLAVSPKGLHLTAQARHAFDRGGA
jgi:hypothetical protein